MNDKMSIITMSKDILIKMALDMDLADILSLCETNKKYNKLLCQDDGFWKQKYEKDFDNLQIQSYKNLYLEKAKRNPKVVNLLDTILNFDDLNIKKQRVYYDDFTKRMIKKFNKYRSEFEYDPVDGIPVEDIYGSNIPVYTVSGEVVSSFVWNYLLKNELFSLVVETVELATGGIGDINYAIHSESGLTHSAIEAYSELIDKYTIIDFE